MKSKSNIRSITRAVARSHRRLQTLKQSGLDDADAMNEAMSIIAEISRLKDRLGTLRPSTER